MLASVMKNSVLYAIYEYDTSLFVNMFCENKFRPQLKCEGKCKLAKMQKQQNEKDAADTLKQLQSEIICYSPSKLFSIGLVGLSSPETIKKTAYYNHLYSFIYTPSLIKPPAVTHLS